MTNSKRETTFPVRGNRAGRLPEDDWALDTETLRAWAAAQRDLEAGQVQAAAAEVPAAEIPVQSVDRAERRRRRWETIRAKAGAGDGVG